MSEQQQKFPKRARLFRRDFAGVSFTAYDAADVSGGVGGEALPANEYIRADLAAEKDEEIERLREANQLMRDALKEIASAVPGMGHDYYDLQDLADDAL